MRLVVDRDIPRAEAVFSAFGDVIPIAGRELTRDALEGADGLIVRSVTRVGPDLLDGTTIGFVGTATAGLDHLDTDYLDRRGVRYFSAPGCNARAVAEYVLACSVLQQPRAFGSATPSIGIVGHGNTGRAVEAIFTALGFNCVISDPPLADATGDPRYSALGDVLGCDIVTLHTPLTVHGAYPTYGLIGTRELARIPRDTLLINAARGGVIEETVLRVWAAADDRNLALDCWTGEPVVDAALLMRTRLATPHVAGYSAEARLRATSMLAEQIARLCDVPVPPIPPAGPVIDLELAAAARRTPHAAITAAVLGACDPRIATEAMRGHAHGSAAARARSFDALRTGAASRREFTAYRIARDGLPPDTVAILRALGFTASDAS